jgi:hypothetical protein
VKPGALHEGIKTLARYGNRAQVLASGTDLISDDKLGMTMKIQARMAASLLAGGAGMC